MIFNFRDVVGKLESLNMYLVGRQASKQATLALVPSTGYDYMRVWHGGGKAKIDM